MERGIERKVADEPERIGRYGRRVPFIVQGMTARGAEKCPKHLIGGTVVQSVAGAFLCPAEQRRREHIEKERIGPHESRVKSGIRNTSGRHGGKHALQPPGDCISQPNMQIIARHIFSITYT